METKLAPGFLVASPGMTCPFFNHTLVLLVEHDASGSLGFVVNRPTEAQLSELVDALGLDRAEGVDLSGGVWLGGPVAPNTSWILFDPSEGRLPDVESIALSDRVAVTASRGFLEALARGERPARFAMLVGYSGWGPGQLDAEIREGSWIPVDLDPGLVFDRPAAERWRGALATLGIDPARVAGARVAEA